MKKQTKIYGFLTGRFRHTGDVSSAAITQEGELVAQHVSSNEWWAKEDVGRRRAAQYDEKFPEGWEFEWVEENQVETNKEFLEALDKSDFAKKEDEET